MNYFVVKVLIASAIVSCLTVYTARAIAAPDVRENIAGVFQDNSEDAAFQNWLMTFGAAGIIADWGTTRWMSKHYDICRCYETNIIMGKHPSPVKVDLYFLARGGLHIWTNYGIVKNIPANYKIFGLIPARKFVSVLYNVGTGLAHGYAAYHNQKGQGSAPGGFNFVIVEF